MTQQKTALITGTGMDAKTMTHFLISKDYDVYVSTRRNTVFEFGDFEKIFADDLRQHPKAKLNVFYMDVSDNESVKAGISYIVNESGKLDEIYHLAASSHVGYSYDTPVLNINTNGMSALYFLEALRNISHETKFYFAATTEMFSGHETDGKYTEESAFYPKTPYGISKCLGAYWVRFFRETYNMHAVCGILANHSNEYRHNSFFIRKITQAAARIALGKQKDVSIGHLEWARDEFLADFGMEAAWKMLQMKEPLDLIIGNGSCKWGEEYVENAFGHFNLNWRDYVKYDSKFLRKNEVVKLEVDPLLAVEKIGWIPERISFEEHIKIMCDWDYKLEQGLSPTKRLWTPQN